MTETIAPTQRPISRLGEDATTGRWDTAEMPMVPAASGQSTSRIDWPNEHSRLSHVLPAGSIRQGRRRLVQQVRFVFLKALAEMSSIDDPWALEIEEGTQPTAISALTLPLRYSSPEDWCSSLWRSQVLEPATLSDDLQMLAKECAEAGWDGYSAAAIGPDAFRQAERFLQSLPPDVDCPSLGAEPDGHITFEWYSSPRRTLSVSVSAVGELHYAALLGPVRCQYGTEPLADECPPVITDLVRRVQGE